MARKQPTQQDVAELAGVSRGTVSRVLNRVSYGSVPISDKTRNRVLQAASELGYAPNIAAQMLVQGQTFLIGVFVYGEDFPYERTNFFSPYLTGVQQSAIEHDYNVLLFTRNHHHQLPTVYEKDMNTLRLADGCIFLGSHPNRPELARLQREGYPFVYIGRREVPDCEINWVNADYQVGAAAAAQHLLELGHRQIGYAAQRLETESQLDKYDGCKSAIDKVPDACLQPVLGEAYATQAQLMKAIEDHHLTALIAEQAHTFHQILALLATTSVRIPADLSILSLTTAEHSLPYTLKPTHLNLDSRHIGAEAVRVLVDLINGAADYPQQVLTPTTLEVGDTTGPAPN